jgi:hypothetical protein
LGFLACPFPSRGASVEGGGVASGLEGSWGVHADLNDITDRWHFDSNQVLVKVQYSFRY